jgi:uncharacterized UBP type Zn finger protein
MEFDDTCVHLERVVVRPYPVRPRTAGCEECLALGDSWVHLRLCMSCGHVGCCDSSPNRHATKHFHASRHPVVKSFEPQEDWAWCYVDEVAIDQIDTFPEESAPIHFSPPIP